MATRLNISSAADFGPSRPSPLPQNINMWVAVARKRQGCRSCELKTDKKPHRCSFRFLDLPAEIRNRIYSYYFAASDTKPQYNLVNYRDPPITLACKQLRRESLPIFFSECTFLLTIGANYFEPERKAEAGRLCLLNRVSSRLIALGDNNVLFRNLHIRVTMLCFASTMRRELVYPKYMERYLIAWITLQTHPKLKFGVKRGMGYPKVGLSGVLDRYAEQIESTLEAAKSAALELRGREGFKGFSLVDLATIAQAFSVS
ncbi:hypothetical protein CB0940_11667 [Cercospora beticola]|uniref:F-box domain-containing protein n=2 Tax=Cercospora beticola TaxID=122368 RepID=A0A2G5IDQ1_CERBT|nr:hypothetical protein CB0940_11667 [Cercospora beticola]PIB02976.1 hypothetical protein CB0940_11667 [Cercospora beticola]